MVESKINNREANIDSKTKAYLASVRAIIDYVSKEFPLADKETRLLILGHAIRPIGFWEEPQQKIGGKEEAAPKWWEMYPELKPLGTDSGVVKIDGFVEYARFDELNTAAKQNGYRYSREDRAFIRSF